MKKIALVIAAAIIFGGVAGGTLFGISHLAGAASKTAETSETTEAQTETAAESETEADAESKTEAKAEVKSSGKASVLDVSDIVEEAMPQVVSITNTMVIEQQGYSNIFDYFYGGGGYTKEYEVPASGSGVIVSKTDDELLIVTNNHVIEDSKKLDVTFIDGETVTANVKGADSDIDIAVIAVPLSDIKEDTLKEIKVAELHDTDDLKVGQGVIAIGNALGYGQTVTVGYISALNREIEAENSDYTDLIQVDAAINPGNSGGALINMNGEVIGINVAKLSDTSVEGIGYSIPIYKAMQVITDLSNAKTKVEVAEDKQGRLGIYMNTVSESNASALGIPAGVIIRGFSDEKVEGYDESNIQESPAKEAGLLKNDIITKFDGQSVNSAEELSKLVKYYEEGTEVEVTVQRLENGAYAEKVIKVTLGSKKDAQVEAAESETSDENESAAANGNTSEKQDNSKEEESEEGSSDASGLEGALRQFLEQYK